MNNGNRRKLIILSTILFFFLTISAIGQEEEKYENFSLYDYNKNEHSLEDFANKKGIVVLFVATQCPVSNAYNSRMAELYNHFKDDFSFIGINSNKQEDVEEIKTHASENNLDFVILKDSNNVIADKFDASFTPEIYILNNNFEQLYQGRIDDSRKKENIEVEDLKKALIEIKEGKEVSVKVAKAFGCSIKRVNK
jgi:peroxiredoxin